MGVFEALKRLFKKKEIETPTEITQNKEDQTTTQQTLTSNQMPVQQTQAPVQQPSTPVQQTLTTVQQVQQEQLPIQQDPTRILESPKKIEIIDTEEAIESWEKTLQAVHQHPLSQVKIINTQILEDLSNVLKSMDAKLNKLEKLDKIEKLDEIYQILIRTEAELKEKGISSQYLDSAISEIERLTIKDKDVIEWIAKQEQVTAQQLADRINLSRSTASFRLNRLADLGILEKEAIGKKIYYKVKKMPKFPEEQKGIKEEIGNPEEPSVQTNADEFS